MDRPEKLQETFAGPQAEPGNQQRSTDHHHSSISRMRRLRNSSGAPSACKPMYPFVVFSPVASHASLPLHQNVTLSPCASTRHSFHSPAGFCKAGTVFAPFTLPLMKLPSAPLARLIWLAPTLRPLRMNSPLLYLSRRARHSKRNSKSAYSFSVARCGEPPPVRKMTPSLTFQFGASAAPSSLPPLK